MRVRKKLTREERRARVQARKARPRFKTARDAAASRVLERGHERTIKLSEMMARVPTEPGEASDGGDT